MGLWDLYASAYDALPRHFRPYQELTTRVVEAVESHTPKGRILDAGCGTGNISLELARRGFAVEAIDRSREMLKRARAKVNGANSLNLEFRECDIEHDLTLYPENSFDSIVSVHALYTLKSPKHALSEYWRVLKPSGHFILAEPQHPVKIIPIFKEIYADGGVRNVAELFMSQFWVGACNLVINRKLNNGSFQYWNEEQFRSLLKESSFRIDTIAPAYMANSDLLTVAVKPRHYFQSGSYKLFTAETREDLEKVWRLRYEVYCLDIGYEPTNPNGLEKDEYDDYATHFLALDENDRAVATMRFIPNNPKGFPMDLDFPLTEYLRTHSIPRALEGGRFIIHKNVAREDRPILAFGLYKCLFEYCKETGVYDIFTVSQSKVLEKYKMEGWRPIGEPFRYSKPLTGGLWVPVHWNAQEVYDNYLKNV